MHKLQIESNTGVDKRNNIIVVLLFFSALICGFVFMFVFCTVPYIVSIKNVDARTIGLIILCAKVPYTIKILFSILLNKILDKSAKHFVIMRCMMIIIQIIVFICVVFMLRDCAINLIFILSVLLTSVIAVQDLLVERLRFKYLSNKSIVVSTTVCTVGYKVGHLVGGAIVLKQTYTQALFMIFAIALLNCILCYLMKIHDTKNVIQHRDKDITCRYILRMLKNKLIYLIIIFLVLYRCADIFIHTFKPVILKYSGFIDRNTFANNAQFNSLIFSIIGSSIVGIFAYKIQDNNAIIKCTKFAAIMQIIPAICWFCISKYNFSITSTTIMISVCSLVFGLSGNILRIFLSYMARSDVNKFTIFASFNSIASLICNIIISITYYKCEYICFYFVFAMFASVICTFVCDKLVAKIS